MLQLQSHRACWAQATDWPTPGTSCCGSWTAGTSPGIRQRSGEGAAQTAEDVHCNCRCAHRCRTPCYRRSARDLRMSIKPSYSHNIVEKTPGRKRKVRCCNLCQHHHGIGGTFPVQGQNILSLCPWAVAQVWMAAAASTGRAGKPCPLILTMTAARWMDHPSWTFCSPDGMLDSNGLS